MPVTNVDNVAPGEELEDALRDAAEVFGFYEYPLATDLGDTYIDWLCRTPPEEVRRLLERDAKAALAKEKA